jgi:hypothetical protein
MPVEWCGCGCHVSLWEWEICQIENTPPAGPTLSQAASGCASLLLDQRASAPQDLEFGYKPFAPAVSLTVEHYPQIHPKGSTLLQ